MSNDKSLRDIWTVTDKRSMDVLRASGGVPDSCSASVITTTSSKEKCESYISNQTQEAYLKNNFGKQPIPCGLFLQPHKENADEDETMSLISSIWTPTIKDECVMKKGYQQNPLLVVKIPGKDAQENENKNTMSAKDSYEKLLTISSDSELSNNCGSDESQDELNDETFGESNSTKSEMTMSNISEATANCEILKKKFQKENRGIKKSESTDSDHSANTIIEKNGAKNRLNASTTRVNSQTKAKQNKVKSPHIKHNTRRRRNVDSKALSSKFSYLDMDSDEILSVSRENLTIQESHSSSQKGGKMSNVRKNIAIETREVLGKEGKTKKITYVRGKIVEETNDSPNKNLKWNTDLCNLNIQSRNAVFPNNSHALKKSPQDKLVEANSNQLYNTKNTRSSNFRQFKNGKLVFDDCLKMNGHFNFIRQDRGDFYKPFRKDFDTLKKEIKRDPSYKPRYKSDVGNYQRETLQKIDSLYEPRYKNGVENCQRGILQIDPLYESRYKSGGENHQRDTLQKIDQLYKPRLKSGADSYQGNKHPAITNDALPNNPVKVTNREYLERKIINASQKYQKHFEEDMRSEVSWNIVQPEKEMERETMVKKVFVKETPTQTFSEDLSKSCQANLGVNQVKKSEQLPKSSQNGTSYHQSSDHFTFHENIRRIQKEEGTGTLPKFIPKSPTAEFSVTENLSFIRSAKLKEERAQKKALLIKDGKEVADLIVGCHTAIDIFKSFYLEWIELRKESINLLEKIMVAIIKCGRKNEKISNLIAGLNIAADDAALIPDTLGSKIAAAVGGFVAKLFGNEEFSEIERNAKEFEVRQIFQKDIDTSSMVYIYGVQCSSQFEDTCRAIKCLHQRTQQDSFNLFMTDSSVIKFLKEVSEYNPSNVAVFYKRLRFEYEMLIKAPKTVEVRAFTRVFEAAPQAVPVIDLLPWKFEPDGFDNSIVMGAWEELFSLFNYSGLSSNDEFLRKVQNCLYFLKKEKAILQRNVQSLLK